MSDSYLKKEFKESDVQRVRNIVNKDYTAKTKSQTGYQKAFIKHKEGDIWEESGKTWTIKNGIRQNITKLDGAKKAIRIPLTCPKCGGPMKHWLAKKMYAIHGFCFDPCTVEMEAELRKAGLYKQYEKEMISGNIKNFISNLEQFISDSLDSTSTFVTEHGDVEDWKGGEKEYKKKALKNVEEYISYISKFLD